MLTRRMAMTGGMVATIAGLIVALALALWSGGGGASLTPLASAPGGPSEGIQVHGHWTIEVTEPDGTLASRREFENALVSSGGTTLANVLGRQVTTGLWIITLNASNPACIFTDGTSPTSCIIAEPNIQNSGDAVFKNLVVEVPQAGTVKLTGSAVAQRDGEVSQVAMHLASCASDVSPFTCENTPSFNGAIFTATTITPEAVQTGQDINVTVELTFS